MVDEASVDVSAVTTDISASLILYFLLIIWPLSVHSADEEEWMWASEAGVLTAMERFNSMKWTERGFKYQKVVIEE